MRFKPANRCSRGAKSLRGSGPREETDPRPRIVRFSASSCRRLQAGFTLAEVLAALLFMAIVIPVAVQGLRIASRAGSLSERKAIAARLADSKLNELVVTR